MNIMFIISSTFVFHSCNSGVYPWLHACVVTCVSRSSTSVAVEGLKKSVGCNMEGGGRGRGRRLRRASSARAARAFFAFRESKRRCTKVRTVVLHTALPVAICIRYIHPQLLLDSGGDQRWRLRCVHDHLFADYSADAPLWFVHNLSEQGGQ